MNGYTDRYLPTARTVEIPQTEELGALAGEYTSEYIYTKDGRMHFERVPAAGGLASEGLTTFYTDTNVADGLTGGGGVGDYVTRADFLPTGEVSYLSTGNTYAYQQSRQYGTGTRRLEGVTTTQQIGTQGDLRELQHATYEYDDAGNVLSVKDVPAAESGQQADQQCYEYDWARRLTGAWTPGSGDCAAVPTVAALGGAEPYWTSYTYDVLGNRLNTAQHLPSTGDAAAAAGSGSAGADAAAGSSEVGSSGAVAEASGAVTSTYARPASGAGSTRPHAVTSVSATDASGTQLGTSEYSYDASGNMVGRDLARESAQSLAWDAEGELASVEQDENGDGSVSASESDEFVYSAAGDRLVRTQDGDVTVYLPGQEITLDGKTGAVSAQRYYTFAGQTVAVRSGTMAVDVTSIFADAHGTGTIQVANTVDRVVRRYTDPFGAVRGSSAGAPADADGSGSGWVGDHGFLDKPQDTSGLTAVGARLYDATLGAFVSVDPVMDLADPQQWNAYAYANQNPVTWSDPTGLLPIGAGHAGYNPRTQPDGGDPCAGAISCVKTKKGSGSAPVKVRECYTAYACRFFATHADAYTTSGGGSVGLVNYASSISSGQTVSRSGAAAIAQAAARAKEMAQIRERDAARNELERQAKIAQASSWLTHNFTTAEGIAGWTDQGADLTGYISMAASAVQGFAIGAGFATCVPTAGTGCLVGGSVATMAGLGARVSGNASSLLSFANGVANYRLGRRVEAGSSFAAAGVGFATGGLGSGPLRTVMNVSDPAEQWIGETTATLVGQLLEGPGS
ncbi:RHS repeat-associated core domain-containing protein [Promicromonospora umidemergens]|uniref:RHS repeat-associated core domain-containing protein n=1 Tax=Promicromonospora umidemergens TaxID=629679 RepID=UPI0020A31C92|nr:RHS repeat-associated core domain-containing protein [Promicromonospora umidemergens]